MRSFFFIPRIQQGKLPPVTWETCPTKLGKAGTPPSQAAEANKTPIVWGEGWGAGAGEGELGEAGGGEAGWRNLRLRALLRAPGRGPVRGDAELFLLPGGRLSSSVAFS